MIFWDTSALVPLLLAEEKTPAVRALHRSDPRQIVWWGTRVEARSALARRRGEGALSTASADSARRRLNALSDAWAEVAPTEAVRTGAIRLLQRHPLRAADALQLAAALAWADGSPEGRRFFSLDARLVEAAGREGFEVVVP